MVKERSKFTSHHVILITLWAPLYPWGMVLLAKYLPISPQMNETSPWENGVCVS